VEITGHPVGGVCPFGLKNSLPVYLDVSLQAYQYVYPAAGSPQSAVKMTPGELQEVTGGTWVDVCK
jgi:prolyl-tRNA editing enzyme YbaK/EbsC (Cys-tRNA(Pro) deacylase)